MRRILIVGNETLGSDELRGVVLEHLAGEPCRFHLVVPATPPRDVFFWSEGQAIARAQEHLDGALARMHADGAVTTGEVGDSDPILAVADVLRHEPFDEIVVSTHPAGVSRWLHQDLPRRLARRTRLPVRHVAAVGSHSGHTR